ncbi:[4Fe-4S] proteins maturation [Paraconiothyrium brasiliense]|uniref:[4Fe-4S] proteins maturation n=1 Tax=Paraconiothyrium brasiliense TaxID=300254 RepID=A0ABR3S0V9_9PLEO
MASPSTMCASCLRAARSATPRPPRSLATAPRPYTTAPATPRPLYLDFLAPAIRASHRRPPSIALRTRQPAPRRCLATAAPSPASPSDPQPARAILHPRATESGEPMRISLSPRAAHRLSKIATDDNNANTALRVTVESGGCHGFQYLMSLTDLNKEPATEEDTLFEGDKGAKVIIDESSLELLNGSTVDYTMELIGSQFKVTGIPGATSSCGCGTSFDIKL